MALPEIIRLGLADGAPKALGTGASRASLASVASWASWASRASGASWVTP